MNRMLRRGGVALSSLSLVSGASLGAIARAGASTRPAAGHAPAAAAAAAPGPTDTPAAQLYAALDELLGEHVDLTVTVVETAVTKGAGSVDTKAAEAALGQNTDDLGAAKASAGEALLMAEGHMAGTAAVLSSGIVASEPSHFAS